MADTGAAIAWEQFYQGVFAALGARATLVMAGAHSGPAGARGTHEAGAPDGRHGGAQGVHAGRRLGKAA